MKTSHNISLFIPVWIIIVAVVTLGAILMRKDVNTEHSKIVNDVGETVRAEKEVFWGEKNESKFHADLEGNGTRTLKAMVKTRAYPGAPPQIPHAIEEDGTMGKQNCLTCHSKGGFVKKWKAFAPVTPHPNFENCRQCHVPIVTTKDFRPSNWVKYVGAGKVGSYLPGSPPPIPHTLQLRENCLACHSGPSSPLEIRSDHPQRSNCRQCHALVTDAKQKLKTFEGLSKKVSP